MIKKSILAGILIGLGVIINLQISSPVIGALLFSFGLITIINMKLPLFTGKVGFLAKNLFIILIFNFIGITSIILLYSLSYENFLTMLNTTAAIKFSNSVLVLFIKAIFCGVLIHFAVKNKNTIITIFAVMIFILIGAEHCVADFPFFLSNITWMNTIKMISIILGNSIGAILVERLSR